MQPEPEKALFKQCSMCGDIWPRAEDFLSDPMVHFVGYQPSWHQPEGFFLFNHSRCGTTFSVPQSAFARLSLKPELAESYGMCAGFEDYCLARLEGKPCPPKCACAYVAHIRQLALGWPKRPLM